MSATCSAAVALLLLAAHGAAAAASSHHARYLRGVNAMLITEGAGRPRKLTTFDEPWPKDKHLQRAFKAGGHAVEAFVDKLKVPGPLGGHHAMADLGHVVGHKLDAFKAADAGVLHTIEKRAAKDHKRGQEAVQSVLGAAGAVGQDLLKGPLALLGPPDLHTGLALANAGAAIGKAVKSKGKSVKVIARAVERADHKKKLVLIRP